jgi:hypothetical protein
MTYFTTSLQSVGRNVSSIRPTLEFLDSAHPGVEQQSLDHVLHSLTAIDGETDINVGIIIEPTLVPEGEQLDRPGNRT